MQKVRVNQKIHQGHVLLVNPDYPFQHEYEEECIQLAKEITLAKTAGEKIARALEEIHANQQIVYVSGKRSLQEQIDLYEDSIKENGIEFTKKYVAKPGCSEHETGLAIDLGIAKEEIDYIRPDFPFDGIALEFRKIASKYGFILRYQEEKQDLTKIGFEPWHFRYVGVPHARIMEQKDLCLEEYISYLNQFDSLTNTLNYQDETGSYKIFTTDQEMEFEVENDIEVSISGNNVDRMIICLKQKKVKA